jgi:hypothetical protein
MCAWVSLFIHAETRCSWLYVFTMCIVLCTIRAVTPSGGKATIRHFVIHKEQGT